MAKGSYMSAQTNQPQTTAPAENKPSDKELNFRALQEKYERQLAQERTARFEAERIVQEKSKAALHEDEEEDEEPYVDKRKLNKTLQKFGQNTQTDIQKAMEQAKFAAKEELKQELWLESNPDFYDVLKHAEKFANKAPQLAESILRMPEGFDRQKLVYQNIKAFGLDKPEVAAPSIQDKIDANRRTPYYQPSGVGAAPYSSQGNFTPQGQKESYAKMQELKNRLRLG